MDLRFAAVGVLAALACAACDDDSTQTADALGVEWRLESLRRADASTVTPDPARRHTLRLEPDGRIAVRSDCNSCGGAYAVAGETVTVGPLACTRAFCGDTSLDPEYPALLEGLLRLDVDGDRLTVVAPRATLTFTR